MKPDDMSFEEKIQKIQEDAPSLINSANQHKPGLTRSLSDFTELVEAVVSDAQSSTNDSSVQFKRCIAALRSQIGALRESTYNNDTIKLVKVIEMVVTKTQQLSSHLHWNKFNYYFSFQVFSCCFCCHGYGWIPSHWYMSCSYCENDIAIL